MGTKIAVEGTQICDVCWLDYPVTDFYKHTNYANGRMKTCKRCHKERTAEYKKQRGGWCEDYEKRKAKNLTATEGTQICNTCWLELPVTDFYKHTNYANGRMKTCKVCHNKGTLERKKQKGPEDYEKRKAKNLTATEGTQTCNTCWLELPVTDFYANANYANGRMKHCKVCHTKGTLERRKQKGPDDYAKRKAKNPPATEGTQICDVCWLDYPVTDFYASANYANGRMKTCKRCHKERTIKLREERLEEELEKKHAHLRQWWEKNKHKYEE